MPRKRTLIIIGTILLISIIIGAVLWMNRTAPIDSLSESRVLMDTEVTLTLYGENLTEAKEAAFETLSQMEKISDPYRDDEELPFTLYQLNNNPSTGEIPVEENIYDQLKRGSHYYEATNGEYNIGIFKLITLWKNSEADNRLPTEAEIASIVKDSNLSSIEFNDENKTIVRSPNIQFDLGSIAKGYSLEKAYETLLTFDNVRGALIDGGGNIKVLGTKDDNHPTYTIGLQDPSTPSNVLGTIPLSSGEVISTSGDYQRYYTIDDTRYSHILSGKTGFPPTYFKSVTILTTDGAESDMLSTILYLLPYDEGKAFLENLDFKAEALWVDTDNVIRKTEGFPFTLMNVEGYTYEE